jgi:uncharacterized protein with PQ loop repeat
MKICRWWILSPSVDPKKSICPSPILHFNLSFRSGAEMGVFGGTSPSCPSSRHCEEWARTYLKYCLCSQKDSAALALGLLSVISWGVAEVPQIITNYRQKSTEGLSVAFLMTWIVGYVCCFTCFLLLGCVIVLHDNNCCCTPMLCTIPYHTFLVIVLSVQGFV